MVHHLRIIILESLPHPTVRDRSMLHQLSILVTVIGHPVEVRNVFIEPVIAQFKIDVFQYEEAGSHTYGQTHYTDDGKKGISFEVSPGGHQIVLEHADALAVTAQKTCGVASD
jgi:hypothetical protein